MIAGSCLELWRFRLCSPTFFSTNNKTQRVKRLSVGEPYDTGSNLSVSLCALTFFADEEQYIFVLTVLAGSVVFMINRKPEGTSFCVATSGECPSQYEKCIYDAFASVAHRGISAHSSVRRLKAIVAFARPESSWSSGRANGR